MISTQHFQPRDRAIPLRLIAAFVMAIALLGIGTALYPGLFVSIAVAVLIWICLVCLFELALALLTVGFFVYPLVGELFGIETSPTLTLIYYSILATAAFMGTAITARNRVLHAMRSPATVLTILLIGWMVFSWFVMSWDNEFAMKKLGYVPFLMLLPLLASQFFNKKNIHRFFWFCVAICLFGVILLFRSAISAGVDAGFRPSASESASALGFSYGVGFGAIMGLGLLTSARLAQWQRLTIFLIVAGSVFSAVVTGSRGPMVALITSSLVLTYRTSTRTKFFLILGVLVGLICVWQLLPMLPSIAVGRYAALIGTAGKPDLGQLFAESRGDIWMISLQAWLTSPVIGIGIGNLSSISQGLTSFSHNFVLEVLAELGIIGALLLTALLIWIGKAAIKLLQKGGPLHVSIVALLIYSIVKMSLSGQLQGSVEFWVSCGLVANAFIRKKLLVCQEEPSCGYGAG